MRSSRTLLAVGALLCCGSALGLTQPDGTVIPVRKPNYNLWDLFSGLGEPIDPPGDAADTPETYSPSCQLNFTLMTRGPAAFKNVFGWYNVVPNGPPALADLHVLLDCNATPNTTVSLNIRQSTEFQGGAIGFFLITPEGQASLCASATNVGHIYYSQKEYNPDTGLQNGQSYIHLLTYDSKLAPATFYFCWEDLFNGGDNEFEDLVAKVDGITCSGGGAPCSTGKQGICAFGTEQCVNGQLACVQQFQPQPEQCNGIDDDCDGTVDNGATCPSGEVCQSGRCEAPCSSGELARNCPKGQVCANGLCLDPLCSGVSCPAGKSCSAGVCVDPCSGVVCPHGQQCIYGSCVDPCSVVACGTDEVCQDGVCQVTCDCSGCPTGQACDVQGSCVDSSCAAVTCNAPSWCQNGACVDGCSGVICPAGQVCSSGQCNEAPDAGSPATGSTGSRGTAAGSSGSAGGRASGTSGGATTGTTAVSRGSSATSSSSGSTGKPSKVSTSSCGCGPGAAPDSPLALVTLALLGALRTNRRRVRVQGK